MIAPTPEPAFATPASPTPSEQAAQANHTRRSCGQTGRVSPLRIAAIAIGFLIFWPIGLIIWLYASA